MELVRANDSFKRSIVSKDIDNLYIFTDNCDRTSGSLKIPDDSEYAQRFGKTNLKHPTVTSAVLRGLPNALPITTQHWYNAKRKGINGRWNDSDFEEFKNVIDDDFECIKKACIEKGYKKIIFPFTGILNGSISKLTLERTPKLFTYIIEKEIELKNFEI